MKLSFENNHFCQVLYGTREQHLRLLESALDIAIRAKGNEVELEGEEASLEIAASVLRQLYLTVEKGFPLYSEDIRRGIQSVLTEEQEDVDLHEIFTDAILVTPRNRSITPKGLNQKRYVESMRSADLVFGIGPAGTGKTYIAMAMAIAALNRKEVERIVLTRPAVEAGEKLGFLPGTLQDKVNPYLRPLYDALREMVTPEKAEEWLSREVVEVAPLAFMRGRTLNNAFVILDEAQNTTSQQMKMFLTRLGFHSRAVVTGDITQIDLPPRTRSGLVESRRILEKVEGIRFCYFDQSDVVRHSLVQRIIEAYQRDNERKQSRRRSEAASGESDDDASSDTTG